MKDLKIDRCLEGTRTIINREDTLLLGIGNDGRADDGLGWTFIQRIEAAGSFKGDTQYRYHLQVEDAERITSYQQVVFVDAFKGKLEVGFSWQAIMPKSDFTFTTHMLSPQTVLYLAQDLYNHRPNAFCLMIEGRAWSLKCGLSPSAQKNLQAAVQFFLQHDENQVAL